MMEIKNLFRAFSEVKGFDGWMIGKLYFYKKENKEGNLLSASIVKRKKNFAVIEVTGEGICIQMVVLKPQTIPKVYDADRMWQTMEYSGSGSLWKKTGSKEKKFNLPEGCAEVASRVFSREEVQIFAEEAGDNNWIHQTERPIVPGLMMAEWLWKMEGISLLDKIMIFRKPVYVQEKIVIYQSSLPQCYFAVVEEQEAVGCVLKFCVQLR